MGLPDFTTPLLRGVRRGAPADISNELMNMLNTPGGPPLEELGRFGRANDIPYWTLDLPYYGRPSVIEAQREYARQRFSEIDGVKFEESKLYRLPLNDKEKGEVHLVSLGIPNLAIFFCRRPHGDQLGSG